MKISRLERARDYEVEQWLIKALDLNPYQVENLKNWETVRFSPYTFYKYRKQNKASFLWRFTILFVPVYYVLLFLFLIIAYLVSGKSGIMDKFYDKFHLPWMNKLNL